MMTREARRKNDQYYLSQGRCPRCGGKRPVVPGLKMCEVCRAINNAARQRIRDERRANGLCRECGKPIEDTRYKTCQECRQHERAINAEKQAKRHKLIYDQRREEGRCVTCGKWAEPGRARCAACQKIATAKSRKSDPNGDRRKMLRRYRAENGLCIDCGAVLTNGYKKCDKCLAKRRDSTRKWVIKQRIKKEQANVRRNQGQGKG